MTHLITADDVLPIAAKLALQERLRLIHLLTEQLITDDATLYNRVIPGRDEFSTDEELLSWETEGWEDIH